MKNAKWEVGLWRPRVTKELFGAEGGTRTPTGFPTTPSRWRVCQFHHFGTWKAWQCDRKYLTEEKAARLPRISLSRAFWPHPSNSRLLRVRAFFHSTPDREQLPPGSCRPADSASASLQSRAAFS